MNTTSPQSICPANGRTGQRVERQTLQSLLLADLRLLTEEHYWFCPDPVCPVAYYSASGSRTFTNAQVRIAIWQKQQNDPGTLICYCFKFTQQLLTDEIQQTGTSTLPAQIMGGIRQGLCACDITNPQGSCCLGNVRRAAKEAQPE